jgi:hypothetical protein
MDMPMQTQRGGGCVAPTHSLPQRQKGVVGQQHALTALSPGKTRYPLSRRLDELRAI